MTIATTSFENILEVFKMFFEYDTVFYWSIFDLQEFFRMLTYSCYMTQSFHS